MQSAASLPTDTRDLRKAERDNIRRSSRGINSTRLRPDRPRVYKRDNVPGCGSDGAGAAAVYEVFGSSQVAGVVGYEERD
jgi:hypothetical protein